MKVGTKVVCIDGDFSMYPDISQYYQQLPVEDTKYIIREKRPAGAEGGILLEEIYNKPSYFEQFAGYLEPAFSPKRFREIDDSVESISEIERILETA